MPHLEFLYDLNGLIAALVDLEKDEDSIYAELSKILKKYTSASEALIWTIKHDDYMIETKTLSGVPVVRDAFLYGLFASCLDGSDLLDFAAPKNEQVFQIEVAGAAHHITHFLAIPIRNQDEETIAIAHVINKNINKEPTAFSKDDILLLKVLCSMVGGFLGVNQCANSLRTLLNFAAKIAYSSSEGSILTLLNNMSRELLWADRSTMWVSNDEKTRLWTQVAHGVDSIEIPIDTGLAGYAFTHKENVICNDPYIDPRFNKQVDQHTGYRTKNVAAIPLVTSKDEVIGVLQCINKLPSSNGFNNNDLVKLKLIGNYAANTLELSRLNREIEDSQKELLSIMGEAVEFRSRETGEHIGRVSRYSEILALLAGLDAEEAKMLANAAPMHDIGKIAIPEAILNKPGKLTDEEFEVMKTHSTAGYSLLCKSDKKMINAAAEVAYGHHEKWDGTGYPRGLAGEEIHIYARIVAIADVFDALGNDRCYKRAWELPKILDFFKEQRGKHFDPRLAEIFLQNIDLFVGDQKA
jgi:HD-GYP domain-containing protein (c-di-GMP phosphodiesterase class II)